METLHISGFGGFREAKIETAPIMIFIGEQATGKSILAKLLYFFRGIASQLPFLAVAEDTEAAKIDGLRNQFSALFPPMNWGNGEFKVSYQCNGEHVLVSRLRGTGAQIQGTVEIEWSAFFKEAATSWSRRAHDLDTSLIRGEEAPFVDRSRRFRSDFLNEAQKRLGSFAGADQRYVPAGREALDRITPKIFTILDANKGDLREVFDPILSNFLAGMEYYKQNFAALGFFDARATRHGRLPDVRERVGRILKAEFARENDMDFLVHPDARRVRLGDASSGQQAALPLLLTLGRIFSGGDRFCDVYFEEPEVHLFPSAQRSVVELLAAAFNTKPETVRFVITTHSPYILSVFGNLMEAGRRYTSKEPHRKLEKIIPKVFALPPGVVSAYALANGGADSIVDHKTGMIKSKIIDDVSLAIDKQFDKLLWET